MIILSLGEYEMIAVQNTTLRSLRVELSPVFARNSVIRAAVFGSYARGEQTARSDIDFLVEFAPGASLLNLGALHEDIRETLGIETDILTDYGLSKEPKDFVESILKDAVVIYEAS
jgi:predicted nucleotidyltransferase